MKWSLGLLFILLGMLLVVERPTAHAQSTHAQPTDILITGRVTAEESGAPLANVHVILVDSFFPIDGLGFAETDSAGYYTFTKTLGDSWWILFEPTDPNYVAEYYNNVLRPAGNSQFSYAPEEAEVFFYSPGLVRRDINAALTRKGQGRIIGKVTAEADNAPLEGVEVEVYDVAGKPLRWLAGQTSNSGVYTVTHLPAGTYKLRYVYNSTKPENSYVAEFYGGVTDVDDAQGIEVGEAATVQGVDGALAQSGAITGVATSHPTGVLLNALVSAYDASGQLVAQVQNTTFTNNFYTIPNLAPGQYRILAEDTQHRAKFYRDSFRLDQATPITVRAGEVTSGINFTLTHTPTLYSVATSKGLPNTIVVATDDSPAPLFTTDGAQSWHKAATTPWADEPRIPQNNFWWNTVALAPREELSGRRILYNTYDHIFRSGDLGETWSVEAGHYPCDGHGARIGFSPVIVSPLNPAYLYAIETCTIPNDMSVSTLTWLSVSTDAGVTWQSRHLGNGENDAVQAVVPSPVVAERVYATKAYGNWWQSNANGVDWQARDFPINTLVPDGQDADDLYGWTLLYGPPDHWVGMRSEDGGENWVEWAQQPCPHYAFTPGLLASPDERQLLFARCTSGILRSEDGGDSWTTIVNEAGQLLTLDLGVPGRLLFANEGQLWASTDRGDSWQLLMTVAGESPTQNRVPIYLPSISAPD